MSKIEQHLTVAKPHIEYQQGVKCMHIFSSKKHATSTQWTLYHFDKYFWKLFINIDFN